jgi:hypothetical protein
MERNTPNTTIIITNYYSHIVILTFSIIRGIGTSKIFIIKSGNRKKKKHTRTEYT